MGSVKQVPVPEEGCRLAEIVQFMCEMEERPRKAHRLVCYPLPRIFKLCPNRPAVEVTRITTIHPTTGEVALKVPAASVRGKDWASVVKYRAPSDFDE